MENSKKIKKGIEEFLSSLLTILTCSIVLPFISNKFEFMVIMGCIKVTLIICFVWSFINIFTSIFKKDKGYIIYNAIATLLYGIILFLIKIFN